MSTELKNYFDVKGRDRPVVTVAVDKATRTVNLHVDFELHMSGWLDIGVSAAGLRQLQDALRPGVLKWEPTPGETNHQTAWLGTPLDGVQFTLTYYPTCYRRGPWRLLIEVCHGPAHHKWGCFDEADQPLRYYHDEGVAKDEAERIAIVLQADRLERS